MPFNPAVSEVLHKLGCRFTPLHQRLALTKLAQQISHILTFPIAIVKRLSFQGGFELGELGALYWCLSAPPEN